MKLTDISWRSRIGRGKTLNPHRLEKNYVWMCIKFGNHHKCLMQRSLQVILCLLIIGGVESNPGPIPIYDVKYTDFEPFLGMKGSRNKTHASSVWGKMSTKIFASNSYKLREFVSGFVQICEESPMNIHKNTNISRILAAAADVNTSLPQNLLDQKSFWGQLSLNIYNDNNLANRKFLSEVWSLGNQLDPLPIQIPTSSSTRPIDIQFSKSWNKKQKRKRTYADRRQSTVAAIETLESSEDEDNPLQPPEPPGEDVDDLPSTVDKLKSVFHKAIWQFTSAVCELCDKKMYPALARKYCCTERVRELLIELNKEYTPKNNYLLCSRCHDSLKRNKVPSFALLNQMNLCPIPKQILDLSEAEITLIKQVKAFMKIFLLCSGKGQKAMRGMTIHFAQQVQEVAKILPLPQSASDILIVNERHDPLGDCKEIRVRPRVLLDALSWLVKNNPLYHSVTLNHAYEVGEFQKISIDRGPVADIVAESGAQTFVSYVLLSEHHHILRASLNQGNPIFKDNAGKQCTAMCAVFISYAFFDCPISWTIQILDKVLVDGDKYYSSKKLNDDYLNVDEITGTMEIFDGQKIELEIDTTQLFEMQGYLKNVPGADTHRLEDRLGMFLNSDYVAAILTVNGYSMAIYIEGSFVYFFDSHSRGLKGCKAADGRAFVMKLNLEIAPAKISYIVNRNCLPPNPRTAQLSDYLFTLTPIIPKHFAQDEELESNRSQMTTSRNRKVDTEMLESESDDSDSDDSPECPIEVVQNFGEVNNMDCVIEDQDILEPDINEILPDPGVDLIRERKKPLNDSLEKHLEVLAFPNLFPDAQNGLNHFRNISVTPLDYFQQRILSNDKRFCGNSEYLFYALSQCDKYKARQKISVCCSMKRDNAGEPEENAIDILGIKDPHIYMSAIRGSASYWKKYLADLISMVKTLSVPTFFLTFSFDDLNSADCVNALWKAEHGYDTPDIDPLSVPFQTRKSLLNKHPVTAARHFSMRLTKFLAFLRSNSNQIFGRQLIDYSVRVEFQSRGSPHAHCLLWLQDAPDWSSHEGKVFLEKNISCSLSTPLKDTVLRYQRHVHTATCRKNNNTRCRFAFPKNIAEETRFLNDEEIVRNKGKCVELKRTEEERMINNYHPILLPILQCNMDIQCVTGAVAISYYIAKYMSKSEPSEISSEIQESIKSINESSLPMRQKMMKIAMTIMRKRQVSAQECAFRVCHLFLRYSTRATVFVPAYVKSNRLRMLNREKLRNGVTEYCLNIIDRYEHRPGILENISLFEFASRFGVLRKSEPTTLDDYDVHEFNEEPEEEVVGNKRVFCLKHNKGKIFERSRPAVVRFPNFHPISDKEPYYYSLILMYMPFREESFCNETSASTFFKENFSKLRTSRDNALIHTELVTEIDRALLRISEFSDEDAAQVNLENELSLDYEISDENQPEQVVDDIFPAKEPGNVTETIRKIYADLNPEQRTVFNRIKLKLTSTDPDQTPERLFLMGPGGTGKSFLIYILSLLIRNVLSDDSLIISALSGKAAHLVNGTTLHRAFSLAIEFDKIGQYHKLSPRKLAQMRRTFQNVKYIIIDEISMVNYQTFRMIHNRLCEIFQKDELFGGVNMLLFGDLMQLNPPRGAPIYKKPNSYKAEIDLWRQFDFIELKQNMRQTGKDPLLDICNRLRVGKLTADDISILQSRVISPTLPNFQEMEEKFRDAIRIVPTVELCKKYNDLGTKNLASRVYNVNAHDTYGDGINFGEVVPSSVIPKKDNKTAGLPTKLKLGVGSRVMLRRNLNLRKGLVNGASGMVLALKWRINEADQISDGDLPRSVLIRFDHMNEPELIECVTVDYYATNHRKVIRRMLPLILNYCNTVHKYQGTTCNKCVIDLGHSLFTKGQAYVALSRVKTLDGLAISDLDVSKLITTDKFSPANTEALVEIERLQQLSILVQLETLNTN